MPARDSGKVKLRVALRPSPRSQEGKKRKKKGALNSVGGGTASRFCHPCRSQPLALFFASRSLRARSTSRDLSVCRKRAKGGARRGRARRGKKRVERKKVTSPVFCFLRERVLHATDFFLISPKCSPKRTFKEPPAQPRVVITVFSKDCGLPIEKLEVGA